MGQTRKLSEREPLMLILLFSFWLFSYGADQKGARAAQLMTRPLPHR